MANALTACRLLMIPVVFWLILRGSPYAILVLGLAALTDFLDGYIARKTNQVTELGRVLDPLTDRLFISGLTLAVYLRYDWPPIWALSLLLSRDGLVLAGASYLRLKGQKIEVTLLGKAATALLLLAVFLLAAGREAGLVVFYVGLTLYLGSGFNYLAIGKKVWEASRSV